MIKLWMKRFILNFLLQLLDPIADFTLSPGYLSQALNNTTRKITKKSNSKFKKKLKQ